MNRSTWIIPSVFVLLAGCATQPTDLAQAPEVWAAEEDDLASPVIPVAPTKTASAAALPSVTELPPILFEDATAMAPKPAVNVAAAPAPTVPIQTNVQASAAPQRAPSYVVASLTDPTVVAAPAQPAPVRVLPQAALPRAIAPPSVAGPKPMAFLSKLEQSGAAPDGTYGYALIDVETGQMLSERNADTPLPPASIAKLLAANAILEAKGPNGTFRTSLLADGPVSGGVLNGDLHLVGSGDPSLNRSDLSGLARRLADAGVRSVTGNFFYHGDALPEVSAIDRGQPAGAIYNPGISGLNLDRNERRGSSPVTDPARYTAEGMRRAASTAGVSLPSPTKGRGEARGQEIAAHDSASVEVILTEMFDISRNMTAEVLGAAAAAQLSRKPSSLEEAAQINADWARSRIGSIGGSEWSGFDFANNSGLSTRSRATPRQMAALVRYGYQQHGPQFQRIYEQQSAGSANGVDFAIRAKIGTMSYVRGLGGIVSVGGRDMVFAIMASDPARSTRNAKAWMGKARRLEQALMSDWLQNYWPSTRTAGLQ